MSNKALTIRGAGPNATFISLPAAGACYVEVSSPPGPVFHLSGLTIRSASTGHVAQLVVYGPPGYGVPQGCTCLTDVVCECVNQNQFGLLVSGSAVFANHCSFVGGRHAYATPQLSGWVGDAGVYVVGDALFCVDSSTMTGGSVTGGGIASGAGIHAHSAGGFAIDVVVSRSTIRGGNNNTPPSQGFGFVGQGVLASGSTAAAPVSFEIIGSSSDAVIGGSGTSSTGVAIYSNLNTPVRVHGPVVVASFVGPVSFLPSLPAVTVSGALHADGELDAAQAVSVTVGSAQANGLFALLFDTRPGFTSVPALTDERLLLSPSAQFVALGVLDSAGGYGTSFVPVTQAPLVVGVPMHWQAFTWGSTTGRWLGSNLEQRRCRL